MSWIVSRLTGFAARIAYVAGLAVLGALPRRHARQARKDGLVLLLTGRFDSINWCRSHLLPLASADCVRRIDAVADGPLLEHEKIRDVRPPRWLSRLIGRAAAKFITLWWVARRERPDIVMGFHLFPSGISALLIARLTGARAAYQMTAGPVEVIGGGYRSENALLSKLGSPSPALERMALRFCRQFDAIIVRGRRAREFLRTHDVATRIDIIAGSIDTRRFSENDDERAFDIAFVGRLNAIKQPEQVVDIVAAMARRRPDVRAVIIGDGPRREAVAHRISELRVDGNVKMLGERRDIEGLLAQTRVFLLTSRSEGLSIALAEAMCSGAVPVVADVGDLSELVQSGVTGWRTAPGAFNEYVDRIEALLTDRPAWQRMSNAARHRAIENNSLAAVAERWSHCLTEVAASHSYSQRQTPSVDLVRPVGLARTSYYEAWRRTPRTIRQALAVPLRFVPPAVVLGSRFRAYRRLARAAESWSWERAIDHQTAEVRRICRLVYARSAFYRSWFDAVDFDVCADFSLEEFQRLPTIDRVTVQESALSMCTVSPESRGVHHVSTGGTGGRPLHFYIGDDRSSIDFAHLITMWERAGARLGDSFAVLRGDTVEAGPGGFRHDHDPLLRHHRYSSFHLNDATIAEYLAHIATIGPCYLHVYPSVAAVLARYLRRAQRVLSANVIGVLAESEILYREQRETLAESLGRRIFSCYGHTEKLILAGECELSTDYHVSPTYGYFELLDTDGRSVEPGQRGEIVGTGFINRVMPFIRYRTGDEATLVAHRCDACGRSHTVIRDIRGHRTQEVLIAVDGSEIPWAALNMHDDTFEHVLQFQFRQDRAGEATLLIVPAPDYGDDDTRRIRTALNRKVAGRLQITIERCSSIPATRRGKAVYVDQRLDRTTIQ